MLRRRLARRREEQELAPVTDAAGLLALQRVCEHVEVDPSVGRYCVELSTNTRRHRQVLIGASPRGSLALLLTSRAHAVIEGRDFVLPEDVKAVAEAALAHRITIKPELWLREIDGRSVVADVLASTAAPPTVRPS